MDGMIELSAEQRKLLLQQFRYGASARISRRAHLLLLLADGWSYREIMEVMFCSSDLIAEVKQSFVADGVDAALGLTRSIARNGWSQSLAQLVTHDTPEDHGFFRTRWSCKLLSHVLHEEWGVNSSSESVRRQLHGLGFVWRRPRPIVGLSDPRYAVIMRRIRSLLDHLPGDHAAVFEDEVDLNLNPKIGSQWMPRGLQAEVMTPGNNCKRYLAGSLIWNTGTLLVSEPHRRRNAELFLNHLEQLRYRLRSYRVIHVICDNAAFHKSKAVLDYITTWRHRIKLHYLPVYAPETNPIERVWWHLHETITRNHRCQTIEELTHKAIKWLARKNNFYNDMRNSFALAA